MDCERVFQNWQGWQKTMSNKMNHLHPITILIGFLQTLKGLVIPGVVILVGNGFRYSFSPGSPKFMVTLLLFSGILLLLVLILIFSFIKWKKFVYWFEEEELRIEYGLFVKKKRYIPLERIQSLNYKESLLHRLFGLVKVKIETAADSGEAEADLTAITRSQADLIEAQMKRAKEHHHFEKASENDTPILAKDDKEEQIPTRTLVHQMSQKDLLVLATTSSSIGVVFSGLAAVLSQLNDWIPYDQIYGEVKNYIKFGVVLICAITLLILFVSWMLSVAITFINNFGFRIEKEEQRLFVSKGLLEKKRLTIPLNRIQGVRIVESPFRQLFGYVSIVIESAGSSGEKNEKKIVLLPLIKKKNSFFILREIFPNGIWTEPQLIKAPQRALFRYIKIHLYWSIPLAAALCFFLFPYGAWSLILIPIAVLLGYWQYRTAGFNITSQQLTIVERGLSRTTLVVWKKRIQSLTMSQSYYAKKKHVASAKVVMMSGKTGSHAKVRHFDDERVKDIFEWYKPNDRESEHTKSW